MHMPTYKLQTSNLILLISHEVKNNRHAQSIRAKSEYICSFFPVTRVVLHMHSKGKILNLFHLKISVFVGNVHSVNACCKKVRRTIIYFYSIFPTRMQLNVLYAHKLGLEVVRRVN